MLTSTPTKEEILWEKLPPTPFSSHMVREIGFSMMYDRADRTCRSWASQGRLRRISHEECILVGLTKKGNAPLVFWEKVK